ncbi:MAG TPA: dTDP-glucose 4,6-dehydratase [Gaiellaceae bacterium]|jgi:dTDP-glucose 4,6-dehydratase|nr:dTDP-glucose 4,6-dehydratase [Gaiellaceae bacterium]
MRILVTGGAGFIGSHFVRHLAEQGEDVVVLDKLTYAGNPANLDGVEHEFHQGDIADPDAVGRAARDADAIVNFAAETHVDRSILGPAEFILTDVLGTQVLLDHARRHGLRLVHVSTDEVYGDIPLDAAPCTEEAPLRASSPYSASKAGGELQVLAYVRTYGVDALITRGANTYGPRQYPEKFLPLFITNAFDRQPLPVYGDGKQRREWLHVEDHCAGIELALRRGEAGEAYNVSGQERENLEVVRRILDLTGASPDLVRHVADRPGHDRRYSVDSSKLRDLGWAPRHSFDAGGLEETVEWYRSNREWWEPIKSGDYKRYYETQYAARLG